MGLDLVRQAKRRVRESGIFSMCQHEYYIGTSYAKRNTALNNDAEAHRQLTTIAENLQWQQALQCQCRAVSFDLRRIYIVIFNASFAQVL